MLHGLQRTAKPNHAGEELWEGFANLLRHLVRHNLMQGSGLSQAGADRAAEVQVGLPTCQALFLEELLLHQLALLQVGAKLEPIKLADEVGQEGEPVGGAKQETKKGNSRGTDNIIVTAIISRSRKNNSMKNAWTT